MTTPTTTWRVPPWAWLPLSLAITAEAAINALRAYGLGTQLEHFTVDITLAGHSATVSLLGAVLVLAAIAISLTQAKAAWVAFKPGALARQRTIAAPIALLLLAVSVSALSLTLLEAQRGKTGDEGAQRTAYDIAKGEHKRADAELTALAGTRTPDEIKAAMGAAPVSRLVFRRTAECTDITKQESFDACRPILDLRQEMARAIRKIELESAVPALKAKLDALPRPAEPSAFELLMGSVWGWIMGLAVVLVATFGAPLFAVPVTGATPATGQPSWQPTATETAQTSFAHPMLLATEATVAEPRRRVMPFGGNRRNQDNGGNPGNGDGNRPRQPKPVAPGGAHKQAGNRQAFEADVLTRLALGQAIESQDDLATAHGVHKGVASKWLKDMRGCGLIPAAQRVGRCHRLVAAE